MLWRSLVKVNVSKFLWCRRNHHRFLLTAHAQECCFVHVKANDLTRCSLQCSHRASTTQSSSVPDSIFTITSSHHLNSDSVLCKFNMSCDVYLRKSMSSHHPLLHQIISQIEISVTSWSDCFLDSGKPLTAYSLLVHVAAHLDLRF